jgi:Periplasmic protease
MHGKQIPDIKVVESMAASSSSNSRRSRWFHIALRVLAIVFAAATVLYTWFWMVAAQFEQPPAVELGLDFTYQPSQRADVVTNVSAGSPAERSGLRVGDQIVAFDGRRIEDAADQARVWKLHNPGDSIRLTILRPGQTAPLDLAGVFQRNSTLGGALGSLQQAAGQLVRESLVLAFAAVGLVILLLRPQDRNVWLLACFFAGIISSVGLPGDYRTAPALLRPWIEAYNGIFLGVIGASFYFLCAVFPDRKNVV